MNSDAKATFGNQTRPEMIHRGDFPHRFGKCRVLFAGLTRGELWDNQQRIDKESVQVDSKPVADSICIDALCIIILISRNEYVINKH